MIKKLQRSALVLIFFGFGLVQPACAFQHPGIPLTTNDLDYVKARLNVQPWKSGWDTLQADGHATTNYVMQGPFGLVSRVPFINQNPWKNDMDAVYKLALRWYYTGDTNYAIKATGIFDAWATTMTNYGGNEAYLDLGDYAVQFFGGPEILRSTYPGWTALNTQHATNYFQKAIRPALFVPDPLRGANQGMSALKSAMGLAIFCDDTNYWNQCLFAWRNDPEGLADTSPLGMVGDTGRDQGHTRGQFGHYAWGAAVAWAQGVDLFSEQDNRIAKCAEYFSKYNLYNTVPYVTFGSLYGMYPVIGSSSRGFDLPLRNIIHTAYVTRKGMNLPWIARMSAVWGDDVNFEFLREADSSTAIAVPLTFPAPVALTNWTDADIGVPAFAGSTILNNGVWTIKGGGTDVNYSTSDQFHFAYRAMTNDFVFIARVLSETNNGASAKAGLMVRDSFSTTANFADVYLMPNTVEAAERGAISVSHGDQVRSFTQIMPYWIKVERRGPWLGRYCSPDGLTWQPMNYAFTTMSNLVYVGLMATANDNTKLMTATMDNVAISDISGVGVAPFAPMSLAANGGNAQAMLSWVAGAGANYCNLKRASSSGGPYTTIAANYPATTYTDLDLTNGTTYYYVVSCTNSVGESSNSIFASITPSAASAVPGAPTGLAAFASDSTVNLNWNTVTNATSYNVKRATSPDGPFTRLLYGTDRENPNFTDMDVTNGVTYYYVVGAVNYFGESANQITAVSGTPQPALVWTGATNSTWDVNTTENWSSNNIAVTYQNGSPVQFDDTAFVFTINPAATVTPSSVLIVASINTYTLNATGIGGSASVMKRGTAALNVNAAQPFSGGMTIAEPCQINFSSGGSLGTGVATANANVTLYASSQSGWTGTLPNGFNIADTAALTYSGDYKVAFNGAFSGGGILNLSLGSHASTLSMSANNSAFNGTVNLNSGPVLTLNSTSSGSSNAVWNLNASGNRLAANVSGGTFYLGEVTGDVGNIYNAQTGGANTATFVIGNNDTDDAPVFSGAFVDNGNGKISVSKQGTNTQTFLGTNNYVGFTTVAAGELIVTRNAIGAGGYTVNNGGTLGVLNQFDGVSLAVSNLTLAAGSGLDFQNVSNTSVPLINASNIILNGNCTVTLTGVGNLTGAIYPLINYSGKFSGAFTNLQLRMPAGWSGVLVSNAQQVAVNVFAPLPAVPTGLTATGGSNQVTLNWTVVLGASGYNVKRSTISGGNYLVVATNNATSFTDNGVTNGTIYYYVVSAWNDAGESANSGEVSAKPGATSFYTNSLGYWQTTANWTNDTIAAGNNLVFNGVASVSTNDFPSGTLFTSLKFANNNATVWGVDPSSVCTFGNISSSVNVTLTNFTASFASNAVVTATAGSLNFGAAISNAPGVTVTLAALGAAINPLVALDNNGTIILTNTVQENFSIPLAGTGTLQKFGPGLLDFVSGSGGSTGSLVVNGNATLATRAQADTANVFSSFSSITLNDNCAGLFGAATRTIYGHNVAISLPSLIINTGSTNEILQSNTGASTFNGTWTGGGALQIANGFTPTFTFAANLTNFTGTLVCGSVGGGSDIFNFQNASAIGLPLATVWLWNGQAANSTATAVLQWNPVTASSATIPIGALWSTNSSSGTTNILSNASSGTTATYQIGGLNADSSFGGIIQNGSGTTALNKIGSGTLTLNGANSYTGLTTVKQGRLIINQSFYGAGGFVVSNVATLGVAHNFSSSRAVLGAVVLAAGATLEFQNISNQTSAVAVSAGLAAGNACTVLITGTNYLTVGNTYPLLTNSSGTMSGFANLSLQMPPGYSGTLVSNANQILLTVTLPPLPATPLNLVATPGDAKVNLSWNSAANATGYNLKRSLTNGGPYAIIATNYAALAFTNTGLLNGMNYFYVVSSTNIAGESANSIQAVARPTSLAATSLAFTNSSGQLQLNWPADHTGWRLQAQTNSLAIGLGTNWMAVPNSNLTNQFSAPINSQNDSVFFRLIYP